MEVDRPVRDVTLDMDGDTIMTDKSGRKSNFAWKSKQRFRSRMVKVTGAVMKMGVLMEVVVLSEEEEAKMIQSVGGEGINTCDAESVGVVESKIVYSHPHGRDHT